jgi:hypothetical protein
VTLCPPLRRLSADHARWQAELARPADAGGGAARLLALWDREIVPHCRAEEEVLLPALARRLSEADAVVVFTTGDHLALRGLARALRLASGAERPAAAAAFAARLAAHLAFEERSLLPALQEALGCDHLAELEGELGGTGTTRSPRPADRPPATHAAPTKGTRS